MEIAWTLAGCAYLTYCVIDDCRNILLIIYSMFTTLYQYIIPLVVENWALPLKVLNPRIWAILDVLQLTPKKPEAAVILLLAVLFLFVKMEEKPERE